MWKEGLMAVMGVILVLTPYLGVPDQWRYWIVMGGGGGCLCLAYLFVRERLLHNSDTGSGERVTDTFVETTVPLFEDR